MAKKTKLGSASRFGARYSTPLKQVVNDIERVQKSRQICPQCGRKSLKRRGYSKWQCSKCGVTMAGGAYEPKTAVGDLVEKIVKRKVSKEELSRITEQIEKIQQEEKGEAEKDTAEKGGE
ncbi:MAG: 50S ribosomal protein L37ae [archaeon]